MPPTMIVFHCRLELKSTQIKSFMASFMACFMASVFHSWVSVISIVFHVLLSYCCPSLLFIDSDLDFAALHRYLRMERAEECQDAEFESMQDKGLPLGMMLPFLLTATRPCFSTCLIILSFRLYCCPSLPAP